MSKPDTSPNPTKLREVELYTDGACSGNPGPGGWAFVLRDKKTRKELTGSGGERDSTNNRMELQAVIEGLKALKKSCRVHLHSDSNYVLQGLQSWMAGWKKKGWVRMEGGKRKPVANVELWQELDRLIPLHSLSYHHVKGHSGHPENERCDVMAVEASQKFR
ncbi:ribonuclease HI [Aureliella helgolandensis]|uniref:Ribonuclease H n=1 Tax=Aureliella helgolandensis TaxID=2527968 RepID=A0A518FZZ2_9BACT|nr:ribonuclease HI [Aureliella helgolandensis]QDV21928.1 Ribonuclease H [Aureliella helgolandensis]